MSTATDHNKITEQVKGKFRDSSSSITLRFQSPQGQLDGQVAGYELLGFREIHREEVHGKDLVREALLQIGDGPNLSIAGAALGREPGAEADRKERRTRRIRAVAFRVKSARKAFDYMKENGFTLIDAAPRPGSRGTTVFFVHPKSRAENAFGFLIEIVEDPK